MNVLVDNAQSRSLAVAQAVARLAAHGVAVNPDVLRLYGRYVSGELSRTQVSAVMQERALAVADRLCVPFFRRMQPN